MALKIKIANKNTNEFLFNISYNSMLYKDKESYNKKNYVCARFKSNEQNQKISFIGFTPYTRPAWYGRKKVLGNYSNGKFTLIEKNSFFYLSGYPFALDLTNNIKFEIPENKLKEINKIEKNDFLNKNEPGYFTIGICGLSRREIAILFRGAKSNTIYIATFDRNGQFINYGIGTKSKAWISQYINETLYILWMDDDSSEKKLYLVRAKISD